MARGRAGPGSPASDAFGRTLTSAPALAQVTDLPEDAEVTDSLTPEQRHRRMASVRRTGTQPERDLRRILRSLGIRFRTNVKRLPGSPDIVVPHLRWILFVHGCFWHGHHCRHGKVKARTNASFWENKIATNAIRDRRVVRLLRRQGWRVTVVWQCQLRATDRITNRLRRISQVASESPPPPGPAPEVRQSSARRRRSPGRGASVPRK